MPGDARLDPATFASDDVVVGVGRRSEPTDGWSSWSERLLARLAHLGRAYELRLVGLIDVYGQVPFNPLQSDALATELRFLGSVVSDPAVEPVLAEMIRLAESVARSRNDALVVSGN